MSKKPTIQNDAHIRPGTLVIGMKGTVVYEVIDESVIVTVFRVGHRREVYD